MRRAFPSLLVAIVLIAALAPTGAARSNRNLCKKYQEQTGCVLKQAGYFGSSQSAVVSFNTAPTFFIFHVHGRCIDAAVKVNQKLRIGTSIKIQDTNINDTSGPVSASLKVVSAKKSTATVTESNPKFGPPYPGGVCNQTVTVTLKRSTRA